MDKIIQMLNNIHIKEALDVATGRGQYINFLKENLGSFEKIIGLDNHEYSLKMAKKKFEEDSRIEFIEKDLYRLDSEKNKYDLISISNSLHHFEKPKECLRKLFCLLNENGYLILNEMHKDGEQMESQKIHIKLHHWSARIDRYNGIYHAETFNHKKIDNLTNSLGLKDKKVVKFKYPYDEENQAEIKKHLKKILNKKMEQMNKNCNIYFDLKKEKDKIIKNLNKYGFASAGMTFIIGRK
ncbi:MAG: class I SAM-dependent methyltransferase [Candidatus Mcinerneyibacterium aminivorans]|uniref:Class I SAM-dependent methyltransferase n=1 Tax=Candidatus Mcinerneyibacterium aminivorans TaxID=2703815 RepID=A0A5D0MJF6_9BACT|nr:MAG: class I SAM-dependent methyltransferase [Candidatus Mcinerneyibacterium aminivorans]